MEKYEINIVYGEDKTKFNISKSSSIEKLQNFIEMYYEELKNERYEIIYNDINLKLIAKTETLQNVFAKENGIEVRFGDPSAEDKPGTNVILPSNPGLIKCKDADLKHFKESLIKKSVKKAGVEPTEADLEFLAEEVKEDVAFVKAALGL